MTTRVEALSRAWASYVEAPRAAPAADRRVDAAVVIADLHAAALREALGGLHAGARAALVAEGAWTEATAADVARLIGVVAASAGVASDARAVLTGCLDRIAWDVALFAAEGLVWLLPTPQHAPALRVFAVASATLPTPYLRPGEQEEQKAMAEAERRRRVLARAPSEPAAQDFLAAARAVPGSGRWPLLIAALPFLDGPHRAAALDDALESAFQVSDEVHVGQAVAAVVARDPGLLLERARVRSLEAWGDAEPRWIMLQELAQTLSVEQLGVLLDDAGAMEDEWARVDLLALVRPRLPADLVARWEELVTALEDEDLRDSMSPWIGLESSPGAADIEAPPATTGSLTETIHGWGRVARALAGEPVGAAVSEAIVQFFAETTRLYEATEGE